MDGWVFQGKLRGRPYNNSHLKLCRLWQILRLAHRPLTLDGAEVSNCLATSEPLSNVTLETPSDFSPAPTSQMPAQAASV